MMIATATVAALNWPINTDTRAVITMAIEKVCMRAVKMIQATSMSRLYKTQLIVMHHGWGLSGIFGMAIATDTATDFAPVIKRQDTDGGTAMMTTVGDGINEM